MCTLQQPLHLGVTACVDAGYSDARIRPWNQRNTQERKGGDYYRESWNAAAALNPSFISITSWNEWHEGTQIEDCMCVCCVVCIAGPIFAATVPSLNFYSGQHCLRMRNLKCKTSHPAHHTCATNCALFCVHQRLQLTLFASHWRTTDSCLRRDYGTGGPSMYRRLTLELVNNAVAKRKI